MPDKKEIYLDPGIIRGNQAPEKPRDGLITWYTIVKGRYGLLRVPVEVIYGGPYIARVRWSKDVPGLCRNGRIRAVVPERVCYYDHDAGQWRRIREYDPSRNEPK